MDEHGDRRDDDTSLRSDAPAPDAAHDTPRQPAPCCRAEGFQHWSPQGLPASTGWCF